MTNEPGMLAGMDRAALQAALSSAQNAYIQLTTGNKAYEFKYSQGDGSQEVVYTRANIQSLALLIRQLQQALGIIQKTRRPIRFVHR